MLNAVSGVAGQMCTAALRWLGVGQAAAVAAAAAGTNNGGGVQCMHALPRLLQRKLPHDLSSGDALAFVADEKHGFSALCDLAASMHIAQNAAMMPAKPTSCCGEESKKQ